MRMILAAAFVLPLLGAPAFAADAPAADAAATAPVAAPAAVPVRPEGATGLCKDGTFTTTHHYLGACSSNKGVAKWFLGL